MRRMAGLLVTHASDPTLPAKAWNEILLPFDHDSGVCIGFPGGGPPVTGARLVRERCDQVPAWQQVRESRDGTDPFFRLETSGPGGPALCMTAGNLGDNNQTPLVAARCQGYGNAAEILELG
jgi:hypothetical protein